MIRHDRKLSALFAVDAALAALVVIGAIFAPGRSADRSERVRLLADPAAVASISFAGGEAVRLVKDGEGWTLDGLPADASRVDRFLEALGSVSSAERVASDRKSWAELGLDGEKARRVELKSADGKALASLTFGDYASTGGRVYAAIGEGDSAYSIKSDPASYAMGKRETWLDLRAWTSPPAVEQVQEIRLNGSIKLDGALVEGYTATRSGQGWKASGVELDAAKVEAMIRALANLRAAAYAEPSGPATKPAMTVELSLGNGSALSLSVSEESAGDRYPASSSQRATGILLPAWAVSGAIRPLSSLKPGS